jgi:hypothetical protein
MVGKFFNTVFGGFFDGDNPQEVQFVEPYQPIYQTREQNEFRINKSKKASIAKRLSLKQLAIGGATATATGVTGFAISASQQDGKDKKSKEDFALKVQEIEKIKEQLEAQKQEFTKQVSDLELQLEQTTFEPQTSAEEKKERANLEKEIADQKAAIEQCNRMLRDREQQIQEQKDEYKNLCLTRAAPLTTTEGSQKMVSADEYDIIFHLSQKMEQENRDLAAKLKKVEDERYLATEIIAGLNQDSLTMKQENRDLSEHLKTIEDGKFAATERMADLTNEKDVLTERIKRMEAQEQSLKDEKSQLENQMSLLQEQLLGANQQQQDLNITINQIQSSQRQLQEDNERLTAFNQEKIAELEKSTSQLSQVNSELNSLKLEVEQLKQDGNNKDKELREQQDKITSLNKEKSQIEANNKKLNEIINNQKMDITFKNNTISDLQNQIGQIKIQLQDKENQLKDLTNKFQAQTQEIEKKTAEIAKLTQQEQKLKQEMEQKAAELKQQQKKIVQLEGDLQQSNKEVASLKQKYVEPVEKNKEDLQNRCQLSISFITHFSKLKELQKDTAFVEVMKDKDTFVTGNRIKNSEILQQIQAFVQLQDGSKTYLEIIEVLREVPQIQQDKALSLSLRECENGSYTIDQVELVVKQIAQQLDPSQVSLNGINRINGINTVQLIENFSKQYDQYKIFIDLTSSKDMIDTERESKYSELMTNRQYNWSNIQDFMEQIFLNSGVTKLELTNLDTLREKKLSKFRETMNSMIDTKNPIYQKMIITAHLKKHQLLKDESHQKHSTTTNYSILFREFIEIQDETELDVTSIKKAISLNTSMLPGKGDRFVHLSTGTNELSYKDLYINEVSNRCFDIKNLKFNLSEYQKHITEKLFKEEIKKIEETKDKTKTKEYIDFRINLTRNGFNLMEIASPKRVRFTFQQLTLLSESLQKNTIVGQSRKELIEILKSQLSLLREMADGKKTNENQYFFDFENEVIDYQKRNQQVQNYAKKLIESFEAIPEFKA